MLDKKDLDILQEVLNEEILSYLDSGYKLDDDIKGQLLYSLCFLIFELAIFIPFVIVGLLKGE